MGVLGPEECLGLQTTMKRRKKMIKPRIKVEIFSNLDERLYHTTAEISRDPTNTFWRPLRKDSEKYLNEVGKIGTQLLREVFTLPGIAEITIKPYTLGVVKAGAFDWKDIEPQVIEALKKTFGKTEQEIEVVCRLSAQAEAPKGLLQRLFGG